MYIYIFWCLRSTVYNTEAWPHANRGGKVEASIRFRGNLLLGLANLSLAFYFARISFGNVYRSPYRFTGSIASEISEDRFVTSG